MSATLSAGHDAPISDQLSVVPQHYRALLRTRRTYTALLVSELMALLTGALW